MAQAHFPDGVEDRHVAVPSRLHRHANPLSLLLLGGMIVLALFGILGGRRAETLSATSSAADLAVTVPHTMRSGIFFEMRVEVTAKRAIADAVVAIDASAWHDLTINTQIPAADKEEATDGVFRFHYGPLKAGDRLTMKVDGQINPPLTVGTRGRVALLDGEAELASVPLHIRVLP
jgi:hypothetical protein